jgi:hypothetical protein
MGNRDFKMSTARQFKRGHMKDNGGAMRDPHKVRNNRKINKARRSYTQLVLEYLKTPSGRITAISRPICIVRHRPTSSN